MLLLKKNTILQLSALQNLTQYILLLNFCVVVIHKGLHLSHSTFSAQMKTAGKCTYQNLTENETQFCFIQ